MTEYLVPSDVPQGGDAVLDFTIKLNGAATEPTAVTVKWKKPDGTVQETDTLAGGGVYRPDGSTAGNDPGHFRSKWTTAANETLGSGYTVTVEGTVSGLNFGPTTQESFAIVAQDVTTVTGGVNLASLTEVKDYLTNINGIALPAGATDARLTDIITRLNSTVLSRFNASAQSELTDQQKVIGKDALIKLAVADLLIAFFPNAENTTRVVAEMRKRAYEDLDASRGVPTSMVKRRLRSSVV